MSNIYISLFSMANSSEKPRMKSAVRVIHTVFRCVYFGKPSGDETAFSTWTSESFSMEQSSTKMTRQVPKATRNDI